MNVIKKLSLFAFGLMTLSFAACGGPSPQDIYCFDESNHSFYSGCFATATPNPNIDGDIITVDCTGASFVPTAGTVCRSLVAENADGSYRCPQVDNMNNVIVDSFLNQASFWGPVGAPVDWWLLQTALGGCDLVMEW